MAINADSYTDVERVEAQVGDMVENRKFTPNSVPTILQVETLINDIADELNGLLKANAYTAPVVLATDSQAYGMLILANTMGVAALVISTLPTEAWTSVRQEAPGFTRRAFYAARYKRILDLILSRKLPASRSSSDSYEVYAGSQLDISTGETKLPIFTRTSTDFPGSRTLRE